MKRIICAVLAAVLCLGVLAGCGARGSTQEGKALTGTWKATAASAQRGFDMEITFEANGTFRSVKNMVAYIEEIGGTYKVDDDRTLTMYYDYNGGELEDVLTYSEEAKECNGSFWYIDGDNLYIAEVALRRG